MHEQFATWYASLSLGQDAAHVERRWNALDALVDQMPKGTLDLLVRLAFRAKVQMSGSEVADLRKKFAGEGATPGDEELIVLAAAALAWTMKQNGELCSLAAAMVLTTSCCGLRKLALPMDLVDLATTAWRLCAEDRRKRPSLDVPRAAATALDKTEVAAAVKSAAEGDPGAAVQALAASLNKVIASFSKRQAAVEMQFQNYTLLQDEELDILWWLHGGVSADLRSDFRDVPLQHRPLGIARELSTLTTVLPGPTAVPALLVRAGVSNSPKLTLVAAVQSMPEEWLGTALGDLKENSISPVITPILFALIRRKELGGEEGWAPAWSKLVSLDEAVELEAMQLAEAAYREFVLVRIG
ncbi:GTPase-associated system all-helical protein GASH [Ideonella sp.]|uniref:GTPase-associated system all-helical protein GASH n=1 Tax=Ideonella sp. TaxID=1929293 RepID=UPI003BB5C1A5